MYQRQQSHLAPFAGAEKGYLNYRPDIDGLRAIAVIAVVAFHAFPGRVAGGFVGVDVFFVISGYLITGLLLSDIELGRFSFVDFYIRRVRRLFPALITVLIATAAIALPLLLNDDFARTARHIAYSAAFALNFKLISESGYFSAAAEVTPLLHLWSLSVEEQFYLIWPTIILLAARGRALLILTISVVIAVSFIVNIYTVSRFPAFAFFSCVTRFWELALGGFLASIQRRDKSAIEANAISLAGFITVLASVYVINRDFAFPGWWAPVPAMGAALLIYAGPTGFVNRTLLTQPAIVFVGLISYPLYLWHWPLLSFAHIVSIEMPSAIVRGAIVLLSFALAWLTYVFIERPIRFGGNPSAKTAIAAMAMLFIGGASMFASAIGSPISIEGPWKERGRRERFVADERERSDKFLKAFGATNCDTQPWISARSRNYCEIYNSAAAKNGTIVLFGDSHAATLEPVIFEIARERDLRVVSISYAGCPPLLRTREENRAIPNCNDFGLTEDAISIISKLSPTVIFVAARWSLWTREQLIYDGRIVENNFSITKHASGKPTFSSSIEAMGSQLLPTMTLLKTISPIIIVKNAPVLHFIMQTGYVRFPEQFEPTYEEYRVFEKEAHHFIDDVAKKLDVEAVEPAMVLCDEKCHATSNGMALYKDDNHLTAQGTMLLKPLFEEAIRRTIR